MTDFIKSRPAYYDSFNEFIQKKVSSAIRTVSYKKNIIINSLKKEIEYKSLMIDDLNQKILKISAISSPPLNTDENITSAKSIYFKIETDRLPIPPAPLFPNVQSASFSGKSEKIEPSLVLPFTEQSSMKNYQEPVLTIPPHVPVINESPKKKKKKKS